MGNDKFTAKIGDIIQDALFNNFFGNFTGVNGVRSYDYFFIFGDIRQDFSSAQSRRAEFCK